MQRHAQGFFAAGTLSVLVAVMAAFGCGNETGPLLQAVTEPATSNGVRGDVPCSRADAGPACGDGRVCVRGLCVESVCGDGIVGPNEACDDGNEVAGDGCTPSCQLHERCGDGVVDAGEECDDGNWYNLDGCTNDCIEDRCGNGREDAAEECDDGNRVDTDACSNACTENRCRNGRLDPGEECDDGNRDHEDGCNNGCKINACGNGIVDDDSRGGREECDDGNREDADDCSNHCTANRCGNARIDPGEVCDGNTSAYTCSAECEKKDSKAGCDACQARACTNFMDALDLVAGCTAHPDPSFRAQCRSVIDCAQTHACGYGPAGAPECFCGSADLNSCQTAGTANGPCQAEWFAAARTTVLAELIGLFSDISRPSGMAYYLIECQRDYCGVECAP